MTKQKYVFLGDGEGDRWYERNKEQLLKYDIVTDPVDVALRKLDIVPKRVVEFGCSSGQRLAAMRAKYGCNIMGVDPSREALLEAAKLRVPGVQSTASSPALQTPFDLVIYGFCLYLTDPEDWLQIAAEGHSVLSAGGHLVIHDFEPPPGPFARRYKHHTGVMSYHFAFSQLWMAHPQYDTIYTAHVGTDENVTILKKNRLDIPVLP